MATKVTVGGGELCVSYIFSPVLAGLEVFSI